MNNQKRNVEIQGLKEIVSLRGRDTKTFRIDHRRRKIICFQRPIHYENADGKFVDIELTPRVAGDKVVMDTAPYSIEVDKKTHKIIYRSKEKGEVHISLKSVNGVSPLDGTLEFSTGSILWKDVYPDTDVDIRIRAHGIRIWKNLRSKNAASEFIWEMTNVDPGNLKLNKLHMGRDSDGNEAIVEKIEEVLDGKILMTETITHKVKKREKKTRIKSISDDVVYPLYIDVPDITESIVAGADDVQETQLGLVGVGSPTFYAFNATSSYINARYNYVTAVPSIYFRSTIGVRFQSVAIPVGATIDLAVLKLSTTQYYNPKVKVYGYDVDDSPAFAYPGVLPATVPKTTAYAAWSPVNTANAVESITVTSIVQEIVDRAGWASGNDISLVGTNINNKTTGALANAQVDAYEHATRPEPMLEIDYTAAGGGTAVKDVIMCGVIPSPR